ncbi:methionine--tRNA ligase [Mycobacterium intracellulare subsp. chimaera]|uniref:methionine--tRNA ligase n=1 Tax=Mycobacterium intracellulare TaxID=1767 RepID=UPI000449ED52|nr:methionine--tRNA ligase [Mycobacterium intracellulare]ARV81140.1 methionine--tRNA ligase [Mycobacterium intracellulare subsp. chimaera]ASL08158.1 methionyl-tRNA synthetase [Mycobacterium intracellulare subsp. chimaera]ASL19945.1 methionyl-tRNA synthetase [Mycobacterium intracellulare subsp. chimaera]ETZ33985.1 methionyl-tRNA synthetase [Mycobacterium intracellulare MIN_052511_1280]KPN53822.1 methionine--tRNA ligase [Mycobacterium intracellulare subsp. chimaera]
MRPYYVTTAITYPNGDPHIGHAYEYVATDAIARFKRLDGFDVRFLTGTDEHGLKMVETAAAEGIGTAELARRNSDVFQRLQERLNISFDRFIRTTDPDHHEASKEIWRRMAAAGDIYLDTYSGWYSVRDERFFVESETRLLDEGTRVAVETGAPVTWTEEQTYFFRLSAYADKLLAHYEANPDFIAPEVRRNEVVSFVAGGLRDLSISRTSFDWGVQVPEHPDHVMYVWVDALTNYLTGVGYPDTDSEMFRRYWPADLHMIGKDIIRFHTVYWPAFLMSAGIELPRRVFAHGFLLNRGEKMSKSVGNVVDPVALIEEFGVDQVRYFLLREVPFGQDGSFSEEAIITRINTDLANELGNLAQRSLSMIAKNLGGVLPEPGEFTAADTELLATADGLLERLRASFESQAMHLALEAIWLMLGEANRYFSAQQPWVLRKSESEADQQRFRTVLYVTCEAVRIAALLVQPVMPESAGTLLDLLGQAPDQRTFAALDARLTPGTVLPPPTGVFPRYQND